MSERAPPAKRARISPVDEFLCRCKADTLPYHRTPLVPWDKGDAALKAFFE